MLGAFSKWAGPHGTVRLSIEVMRDFEGQSNFEQRG